MNPTEPVWGLVLAGGRSRRMGTDKALLETGGQTQLARTVALLERRLDRVFVSTRADQSGEPERSKYQQIVDRHDDLGPVAGILSAMQTYPDVSWLVVACDLPNIDDGTIKHLLDQQSGRRSFTAYSSSHDGLPEPLCAIYHRDSQAVIQRLLDEGLKCPRKMLIRSDTQLLEQPNPAALDNVNTPEDLAQSNAANTSTTAP